MTNKTFKKIELVGTSTTSIEEAVSNALERASRTLHNLRWFEVVETRGNIAEGKVFQWQVTIKVGFTLDEAETEDE